MGKGIITGGSGGLYSDDVTAAKADVLEGKSTITSDSDDEVVQGTMPLLPANSDMTNVMLCFDRGSLDFWGKGGAIDSPGQGRGIIVSMRPEDGKRYALDINSAFVFMPVPDLRAENIRADKNIAKIQGSIPVIGKIGVAPGNGWFNNEFMFILNIPQGIYEAQGESWAPELRVPIQKVREILGVLAHKIAADESIAGVQGTLPVWNIAISGHGDVMYSWAGEGHYYDHPISGRGVILRIPNDHIIRGGNWVYLAEPDLIGPNIRQGVNMFGVEGTLPDYSAGRVAFNGATFDGTLLSGVADKGKEIQLQPEDYHKSLPYTNYTSNSAPHRKFNGIKDGGLHFSVISTDSQYWRSEDYLRTAVFFADSVNMTPFKKLKIGVKFFDGVFKVENYVSDSADFEVGIDIVSVNDLQLRNEGVYKYLFKYVGGVKTTPRRGKVSISNRGDYNHANNDKVLQGIYNWQQMYKELDVSDINEQCFLIAYCLSVTNYSSSYAVASGILNHIEFIN